MSKPEAHSFSKDAMDNARVGYEITVLLLTSESQIVWARYSSMLTANSILVAIIGLATASAHPIPAVALCVSVVGLCLCLLWLAMIARAFDYFRYWIACARELEVKYLHDQVRTISRGKLYGEGEEVHFQYGAHKEPLRMSRIGRNSGVMNCAFLVIGLFVIIYMSLALYNGVQLTR